MPPITTVASPMVLLLATLGVWRVTHFLWGEDGPGDIVVRIRRLAGNGFFGRVMDCFYCLSLWVAAPFAMAIAGTWPERVLTWFGLSGGAILLERLTTHEHEQGHAPAPRPSPETEERDVLLR